MLKLVNIKKDYILKDQEPVRALKGISLNFRRNEFVAVLGPSGCGKTTLLNIIGGLDQYTSGDLIIEGVSTKDYKDRDWDTYRNHSIGFVFQSYNLISHQTLLQNVELALTISGVSREERRERAKEALKKVGLEGLEKKRPSQLSGGQMQRVAIARSLVNNPEILLADEPTGALDSETSIQIMDLLKEVANDRLVIMVTHNPDLANKYASRIVRMKDGLITDDSNPYDGKGEVYKTKEEKAYSKGNKKKTSMSFFTATGLSFSNLLAKLKRTILVMIAGSIGIIGVSSVLAVSHGVNNYIAKMQNDMLSSYPIGIAEETVDYTSLMTGLDNFENKTLASFDITTQVGIDSMITYLMSAYKGFTTTKTNDINQEFVDYIGKISSEDAAITTYDYGIDVTNNIFTHWYNDHTGKDTVISLNGLTQAYIAELKTVNGFSDYAGYVDLFTDFMQQLPDNEEYILSQYDLLGDSKFATEENEIMIVVDDNTTMTDVTLAQMGFFDHDEFINLANFAIEQNKEENGLKDTSLSKSERQAIYDKLYEKYPYRKYFEYTDILGKEFYYFPHDSIYSYSGISIDEYDNITTILNSENQMITLKFDEATDTMSGILINSKTADYSIIYLKRMSDQTEIINPEDKIKGLWGGIVGDTNHYVAINLNNPNGISNMVWFVDDISSIYTGGGTPIFFSAKTTSEKVVDSIYGYNYSAEASEDMINNITSYNGQKMKIVGILRVKESTTFGCLNRGVYYTSAFGKKYIEDARNSKIITDSENGFEAFINSAEVYTQSFKTYVTFDFTDHTNEDEDVIKRGYASSLNSDLSSSFAGLFSSLTGVNYFDQNQKYLRSLSGLKGVMGDNGYTLELLPKEINIYPVDFERKDNITAYLDAWNDDPNHSEISYKDTISLIVAVITTLIDAVTIALIAFTSLSLLVSCFMIAVITYISVMERVKEIGVIRSLGGRKKDVSRLFIAETLITGLLSGLFGIIMTYILCIILNIIIAKYNIGNLGDLTLPTALIMIGLSVLLSVISGLIPSMRASNQDPVAALRSE